MTTLGRAASNVIVYPGATFQMFAITNQINKVFTIGGDGSSTNVSATSGNGNTIVGPMAVTNDAIFNVNNAAVTLTLNNVITGPGKITKVGAGLLNFAGNSPAYAGGLQVNVGSVCAVERTGFAVIVLMEARLVDSPGQFRPSPEVSELAWLEPRHVGELSRFNARLLRQALNW